MAGNRRDVETDIIGRDRFSQAARSAGRGAQEAQTKMDKLKDGFSKLSVAGLALGGAIMGASRIMDRGLKNALSKATAEVALGEQGFAKLSAAAEQNAHALGLSKAEFIAAAGQTARLTANLGFSQEAAAAFGSAMPVLADRLSLLSAGQTSAAEASDMMRAALAGEFDPLQTLGLAISAARVEQVAANIATREGGRLSGEQAKALAVQEIVTRQTAIATEVANTEAGRQAQKVKEAKAQLKEFADAITAQALPALAGLTGALSDTAETVTSWDKLKTSVHDTLTVWKLESKEREKSTDATKDQTSATDASAKAIRDAAAAQDALAGQIERTIKAQVKQADKFLGGRSSARDYQEAIDKAAASVKENGRTLDITTEKGRNNQEALDAIAEAAGKQQQAMVESGASQRDLNGALEASRGQLIKTGIRMGLTGAQAEAYATKVLGIPAAVTTNVTINTAAAMVKVDKLLSKLAIVGGKIAAQTSAANNANNREGRGANFAAGGSWAGANGGRVGGPSEVSVTTQVMLDGAPFYAMTQSAAQVATSRAAHRARVGRR